jgi:hypothetical protein
MQSTTMEAINSHQKKFSFGFLSSTTLKLCDFQALLSPKMSQATIPPQPKFGKFDLRFTRPAPVHEDMVSTHKPGSSRIFFANEINHPYDYVDLKKFDSYSTSASSQKIHLFYLSPEHSRPGLRRIQFKLFSSNLESDSSASKDVSVTTGNKQIYAYFPTAQMHLFHRLTCLIRHYIYVLYETKNKNEYQELFCDIRYMVILQGVIVQDATRANLDQKMSPKWQSAHLNRFAFRLYYNLGHAIYGRVTFQKMFGSGWYEEMDALKLGEYSCKDFIMVSCI